MEEEIERLRKRLQRPTEKYQDEVRVLPILDRKFAWFMMILYRLSREHK